MNFYGSLLCKILEILQFFQYGKMYEKIDNDSIDSFYRIYLLAGIITMGMKGQYQFFIFYVKP